MFAVLYLGTLGANLGVELVLNYHVSTMRFLLISVGSMIVAFLLSVLLSVSVVVLPRVAYALEARGLTLTGKRPVGAKE